MAPHRHLTDKTLRLALVVVLVEGLILSTGKKQALSFIPISLTNTALTMFRVLARQYVTLPMY